MRRPGRPGRFGPSFLLSLGFAAGFVIRDLMEETSVVRDAAKDLWNQTLNLLSVEKPTDEAKEDSDTQADE